MKLFRFWLGRNLVHFGLAVMPQGRCQAELYNLFNKWGRKVAATAAQ
jgi:hypothetical protein